VILNRFEVAESRVSQVDNSNLYRIETLVTGLPGSVQSLEVYFVDAFSYNLLEDIQYFTLPSHASWENGDAANNTSVF
jgi:hypothetical protein